MRSFGWIHDSTPPPDPTPSAERTGGPTLGAIGTPNANLRSAVGSLPTNVGREREGRRNSGRPAVGTPTQRYFGTFPHSPGGGSIRSLGVNFCNDLAPIPRTRRSS